MRQLNFFIIFVFCLAIALFAQENVQVIAIQLLPGIRVQVPLAIELLLTMGFGAGLAWLFAVWTSWQQQLVLKQQLEEIRDQREQIAALETEVANYQGKLKGEIKSQPLLPASDLVAELVERVRDSELSK
ncbi:MAG: LapA family protein [Spirulinaceae cyanobacterium SM2_1_0]|nr:LapA family protein [Spirulinaceae cyanobacterium SM2_1_0]